MTMKKIIAIMRIESQDGYFNIVWKEIGLGNFRQENYGYIAKNTDGCQAIHRANASITNSFYNTHPNFTNKFKEN